MKHVGLLSLERVAICLSQGDMSPKGACPFTSCVTLRKSFSLSVPQFPHLQYGNSHLH